MTIDQLPLVSVTIFLPLLGALFVLANPGRGAGEVAAMRWAALLASLLSLGLSLLLWWRFDSTHAGYQFVERHQWFGDYFSYQVGIDAISVLFFPLTTLLVPICIIASWHYSKHVKQYLLAFLVLETLMLGVFGAMDMVLFYVFFEGVLIPMLLIIGIWGGDNRVYAAYKFFLYTLLGSVLMLLAAIYLIAHNQSGDFTIYSENIVSPSIQTWLWLAFFASFAVKLPMWPFHTWLPDAHVQAPTAGSVILAGVLLKLGGYGMLRFMLPVMPDASAMFAPMMMWLGAIAIVYTSAVALVQTDVKKLIAYSSVAHMGFVTIGIFSFTREGIGGALFQMLSHGLISSALFLCVGVVYDRLHTREISAYGGLTHTMPRFALLFMIFTMANVGLPGTSGFIGEFLSLAGGYSSAVSGGLAPVIIATTGVILAAGYALWLYRRMMFEHERADIVTVMTELDARELLVLGLLAALVILFGVMPAVVLETMAAGVGELAAAFAQGG